MVDNIKIYDNFLNKLEINYVKQTIDEHKWEFGHFSDETNFPYAKFWFIELRNNEKFFHFMKNKIEQNIKQNISIDKLYINGQTFGLNGSYHIDNYNVEGNMYTICVYINNLPNDIVKNCGGEIQIKVPDKKYSITIEPFNGRGILFPCNFLHKGNAFDRFIIDLRICIACKFKIL